MRSGEGTNTNFIVFGWNRSGFEPKIYCIRGKHVNNYTTDAVHPVKKNNYLNEANAKLKPHLKTE